MITASIPPVLRDKPLATMTVTFGSGPKVAFPLVPDGSATSIKATNVDDARRAAQVALASKSSIDDSALVEASKGQYYLVDLGTNVKSADVVGTLPDDVAETIERPGLTATKWEGRSIESVTIESENATTKGLVFSGTDSGEVVWSNRPKDIGSSDAALAKAEQKAAEAAARDAAREAAERGEIGADPAPGERIEADDGYPTADEIADVGKAIEGETKSTETNSPFVFL